MTEIKLKLRAWHFAIADYEEPCLCAIAIAAMEHFNVNEVIEGLDYVDIIDKETSTRYFHPYYDTSDFDSDFEQALDANFSNKIIRTIQLTPSNRPGAFNSCLTSFIRNQSVTF
jgi:hypothetical protein